jgi:hypothetical protein
MTTASAAHALKSHWLPGVTSIDDPENRVAMEVPDQAKRGPAASLSSKRP